MKTPPKVPSSPAEPVRKLAMALFGSIPVLGNMSQLLLDQVWKDPGYHLLKQYVESIAEDLARLEAEAVVDWH